MKNSSLIWMWLLSTAVFFVNVIAADADVVDDEDQVIKASAYLDVRSGKLISPANLVIRNGIIDEINPQQLPENAQVIKLQNKILLPGLMDMHTHLDLDFNGSFDAIISKESASKGSIRATKNAKKTLMAGFTTVRNIGQVHITHELIDVALSEAINEGWIIGPTVIPAGHMISILGGHGDLTLGMAEGLVKTTPEHGIVSGVDEVIKAVRYQIKHGAKVIKIHATSGVLSLEDTVGAQQLSFEEMQAAVEEAGRHGIKVAAHAHGTEGMIAAIKAGVHSIEHGSLLDDKAIKLMKDKGVFLVPTTGIDDYMQKDLDKLDPKMAEKARYVMPLAKQNLAKAIKSGVKIALGTDAPLIPHGKNAHELGAMVKQGMSSIEAIRSATIHAAELVGLQDRGEIKKGLVADLIAVSENPLQNLATLESVGFVMKGGIIYKND